MSRQVNADVVVAGLEAILAVDQRSPAVVSIMRTRAANLRTSVMSQASQGGTPPPGYVGLALSRSDATILLTAIDGFNTEYANDDERARLAGIAAALRRET